MPVSLNFEGRFKRLEDILFLFLRNMFLLLLVFRIARSRCAHSTEANNTSPPDLDFGFWILDVAVAVRNSFQACGEVGIVTLD